MHYVALVTVIALLQFLWFGFMVARARGKYGVHAPATTGNETFERHHRVHMNTLEQLVMFLPALWMFAAYVSPLWASVLGGVYIIGRAIYSSAYVRDPRSRSLGFALSALPTLLLLLGVTIWAIRAVLLMASAQASIH